MTRRTIPHSPRRRRVAQALAVIGLALIASSLAAAPYPTRPIRLVLALSAGGVMDTTMRMLAEKLEPALGQPLIIDNRPGASGNIASDIVAKSAPDGYTLLVTFTSFTVLPSTYGVRAVDPVVAFAPVTKLVTQPLLIVINPALGVDSLSGLVATARAAPGQIAYATGGVASLDHLSAVVLSKRAGIEMVHVPYTNVGQEIKDLLGGQVRVAFILLGTAQPYLRTGQLRALAFTSAQRVAAYPKIPTVAESGFPGFEMISWFGVLAPAGTPSEIIDRLNQEFVRALSLPDVRENLASKALEPIGNTPEQFGEEIKSLVKFWRPVIKDAGIESE
jgi:tripartite-type tricarboxylate transporter receptor subunit TctC